MKVFLTILLITGSFVLHAQDNKIVKYYDSAWWPVEKEKAIYYTVFEDRDSFYNCTSYYYPSNKLQGKFISVESNIHSVIGLELEYYQNGQIQDSSFYYPKGKIIYNYSFYEDGKKHEITQYGKDWGVFDSWAFYKNGSLWAHTYKTSSESITICNAFDEERNSMPDYMYKKRAEFHGGLRAWQLYLERNLERDLPVRNRAPIGKYTVYLTFTIGIDGRVTDVAAENDPGYGTKEEAIRVVKKGPKWEPAVQLNNPVKYRHKQGITFVVSQ